MWRHKGPTSRQDSEQSFKGYGGLGCIGPAPYAWGLIYFQSKDAPSDSLRKGIPKNWLGVKRTCVALLGLADTQVTHACEKPTNL